MCSKGRNGSLIPNNNFFLKHRLQCLHVTARSAIVVLSCTKFMIETKEFSVGTKTVVLNLIQGSSVSYTNETQELLTVPSKLTKLAHSLDIY
jgi:hypothetical protein